MTKNQIDYQRYLEDVRHNRAYEDETVRHNQATESAGFVQAQAAQQNASTNAAGLRVQAQGNAIAQQNANANTLNSLTNERAQTLREKQWNDPWGGTGATNVLGNLSTTVTLVGRFLKLIGDV